MVGNISPYKWTLSVVCCLVALRATPADETGPKSKPAERTAGLPGDFIQTVEVPAVKDKAGETLLTGAKLRLSVEQGWLVVRRETPAGDLEWQVVLARADDPKPPEVQVDKSKGTLELRYGTYFIRDNFGALRVFREPKTDRSLPWPQKPLDPQRTSRGSAGGGGVQLSGWESGDWYWGASGLPGGLSDVWVRLNHKELVGNGFGFSSRGRLVYMFHGHARMQDEGDLLVAERALPDGVENAQSGPGNCARRWGTSRPQRRWSPGYGSTVPQKCR